MKRIVLLTVLILLVPITGLLSQTVNCVIRGTVKGGNETEVLLIPITEDFNNVIFLHSGISIPIVDDKFEYTLIVSDTIEYFLVFKDELETGAVEIRNFFPDSKIVDISINREKKSKKRFVVKGGEINDIRNSSRGTRKWIYNYMTNNDNLFAYTLLYREIFNMHRQVIDSTLVRLCKRFSGIYSSHPYTKRIKEMIDPKIGNKYIDFSLPDLNGEIVTLSEIINKKVAILIFWGSWCGSCRIHAKSMIPKPA